MVNQKHVEDIFWHKSQVCALKNIYEDTKKYVDCIQMFRFGDDKSFYAIN